MYLSRVLRARHAWPRRRGAEQRDELSSLQLIELHRCPLASLDRKDIN
jgi:hypothetical protein